MILLVIDEQYVGEVLFFIGSRMNTYPGREDQVTVDVVVANFTTVP